MAEASKDDEFHPQLKDLIDHYNEISPSPLPADDEPIPQQPLPDVTAIELRDTDPETFRDDARERMYDQRITSEDELENTLTEVWETVSGDILESVFHNSMCKLEWVTEHDGECSINSP
jgi:hypothetical protein